MWITMNVKLKEPWEGRKKSIRTDVTRKKGVLTIKPNRFQILCRSFLRANLQYFWQLERQINELQLSLLVALLICVRSDDMIVNLWQEGAKLQSMRLCVKSRSLLTFPDSYHLPREIAGGNYRSVPPSGPRSPLPPALEPQCRSQKRRPLSWHPAVQN